MTRFVIGDHHFNHPAMNQPDYADRPFSTEEEMNAEMTRLWEETVESNDTIIYLGDGLMGTGEEIIEKFDSLSGRLVYLLGNHDEDLDPELAPFPVVEDLILQYHGYRFYCTHRPENVPDDWNQWVLHGHVHNSKPFIDYDSHLVNVSADVIGFSPVPLPMIVDILKQLSNGDVLYDVSDANDVESMDYRFSFI